jgi:hypothetical protein
MFIFKFIKTNSKLLILKSESKSLINLYSFILNNRLANDNFINFIFKKMLLKIFLSKYYLMGGQFGMF